jgi:hypothetical protein
MAIKPLKLKRYISEEEAAKLLSFLIGEDVSGEDMAAYALEGIIPAYMQFSPVDQETYKEGRFSACDDSDYPEFTKVGAGHEMSIIPYPLPSDGWIKDSIGFKWRVCVESGGYIYVDEKAGSSYGDIRAGTILEDVTPDHYIRIYVPQEVCQVAQIMNDPTACPTWPAIFHSHGDTWQWLEEDESVGEGKTVHLLSPFRYANEYMPSVIAPRKHPAPLEDDKPLNWPMVVAGLLKLLEPQGLKQHQISEAVAEFNLPGAGKRRVDDALSEANKALSDPGRKKRRQKIVS